jgi:hypothetical protein
MAILNNGVKVRILMLNHTFRQQNKMIMDGILSGNKADISLKISLSCSFNW